MTSRTFYWLTTWPFGLGRFVFDGFVGMIRSLPRMLFVVLWFGFFSGVGVRLSRPWGVSSWLVVPSIIALALVALWFFFLLRACLAVYPLPFCIKRKCHGVNGYSWTAGLIFGHEQRDIYRFQCMCGDDYIVEGKNLYVVLTDGTKLPYMIRKGVFRWVAAK